MRAPAGIVSRLLALLVGASGVEAFAQDISVARLVEGLEEASRKNADLYRNVGITIHYSMKFDAAREGDESKEHVLLYEYRANEPRYCLKITPIKGSMGFAEKTMLVNEEGYFLLRKPTARDAYVTDSHDADPKVGIEKIYYTAKVPRAGYYFWDAPIARFFTQEPYDWKIEREGKLLKTAYTVEKGDVSFRGELMFRGVERFALTSHRRYREKAEWTETVAFEGDKGGVPLVKRVEVGYTHPTGIMLETWEVKAWKQGPFPATDFSLQQYGNPPPAPAPAPPPTGSGQLWVYLFGGFFAVLIGASLVRFRKDRRPK